MTIAELKNKIEELKDKLDNYKRDPMAHDELAETIQADHDAASFAEWIASCDNSFYSQSLNDFADSYDVESLDDYKDLESQIDDLESELFDLENTDQE